ncbi:MAG: cellulase family glycosylhydrolase [Phycisphaerae bacterium]|nr:cellulase family glycosylhydrolase [Phycisphaerae bacterium]
MNILNDTSYSWVRGFNYQPSYASHGLELWGAKFNLAAIEREIGRGKRFFPGMNTLRLWLSHDAFIQDPEGFVERFARVLDVVEGYGLRAIATLFNGWRSYPDFGGTSIEQIRTFGGDEGIYGRYLDRVVGSLAEDQRILLWDLCNEPFNNVPAEESRKHVLDWLTRLSQRCKSLGAASPLCVGHVPSLAEIERIEPISDVITFHPYYAWNSFAPTPADVEAVVDETVALANRVGKPLLATETGWGALEDAKRVEVLTAELSILAKRKIGFTAHALHESPVADLHRAQYGPIGLAGFMAFVLMDGSLRPGHEVFNRF